MAPKEPTVSARAALAPPWSRPYGWVFPSTGIVATTVSALTETMVIPRRSMSVPG